ncbi:MAG: hypothetical protein J2O49_11685, partial [Sciscionella sp.]|nr:hypothetical protein [Sciscionella sp.]
MTGADGAQIAGSISVQLDYLGKVADYLKVPDVVSEYFTPMLGRWSDLERAATGWRAAADTADKINGDISGSLGAIDSAWRGADADAFVAYLRGIGAAGTDLTDALRTMAD